MILCFDKIDYSKISKYQINTDGVSSITDDNGKSYWQNTIDKTKKYQVKNMNMKEHYKTIQ